jgi:hypothetical protein
MRKIGIIQPKKLSKGILELQPVLKFWISLLNTQRQAILALGLDPQDIQEKFDLDAYVKEKYGD